MLRWWWRRVKFRLLVVEMLEGSLNVCLQTRQGSSPLAGCWLDAALRGTGAGRLVVGTSVLICSRLFGQVTAPKHDEIWSVFVAVALWRVQQVSL